MKNIYLILALIGIIMSCSESPITGTGDDVVTGSSTIFGKLLTDGEPAEEEATVNLYRENSAIALAKVAAGDNESLIATMETENAAYSFASLKAGTYRIEVTRQGIVIGEESGIVLDEDDSREINITVVIIINQTFNIETQQNVTINNFIIENGEVTVSDNGYVLVFAETDTFLFRIEIDNDGETETIEVVSAQEDNGTFTIEPSEPTDAIVIAATGTTVTPGVITVINDSVIDASVNCPVAFENSAIVYKINEILTITSDCEVVFGPDITIDVNKPIVINDGGTLRIKKGTTLRFANTAKIQTGGSGAGTLIATGTEEDSVRFVRLASSGAWGSNSSPAARGGIRFYEEATSACSLSYCSIRSAYFGVRGIDSRITICNSTISNCESSGIRFEGRAGPAGSSAFHDNILENNDGYGIEIAAMATGYIDSSCSIRDNTAGGILINGSAVEEHAIWHRFEDPYAVSGGILVGSEEGTVLTIEPGTVFKMIGTSTIKVGGSIEKGTLIANGTPGDSITFTGSSPDGNWGFLGAAPTGGSIWFNSGATAACSLTYCIINKATTGIVGDNATLTISHCRISNCRYYGIRFEDGASPVDSASFIDNTITGNQIFGVSLYANYVGTLSGIGTFADNGSGGILIHGDVIDQDAVWKKHDAYYVVEGQLSIGSAEGATLTIRPGATFLMDKYSTHIKIGDQLNGTLIANGTGDAPITFAARNSGNKWGYSGAQSTAGAIMIYNGSTGTSFTNCIVDNASTGFRVIDAEPTIADCEITNCNYYGMYLDGCEGVNFSGNTFSGNESGDTYVKE